MFMSIVFGRNFTSRSDFIYHWEISNTKYTKWGSNWKSYCTTSCTNSWTCTKHWTKYSSACFFWACFYHSNLKYWKVVTIPVRNETTSIEIKLGIIFSGTLKIKYGSKNKNPCAYNNKMNIDVKITPDNTMEKIFEKTNLLTCMNLFVSKYYVASDPWIF